jgi:ferredoxin
MGLQNILVRMDACDECSWGALQPHIEQQIQGAQRLLEPHGWFDRVSCVRELQTEQVHERPVWDADNPPLSRRDLFRLASRQSQIAAARAISANEFAVHQKILGRDRRRIIAALDHIELLEAEKEGTSLEGLGYATLSISNACTACGVCARSCPTGALIYNQDKENLGFSLEFIPDRCIACQVCLHVCAPGAVSIDDAPRYKDVFRIKEPIILREGSLARCGRCGVLMASRPDSTLCPLCEHRRKNPFGSKLPPGFKGRDRTDPGAEEK